MPTSKGAQLVANHVVQHRVHAERDRFIESIAADDVLRLASLHHGGELPVFFHPPGRDSHVARGSYNVCYFVRFRSSDKHWVVRVPLRPCLGLSARSKLETEVATMNFISQNTTIPIPEILAFGMDEDSEPLSTFLILEFIQGDRISFDQMRSMTGEQRASLYTSLADIHMQLRRLEFPSIGSLAAHQHGFRVAKMNMSMDINMQEVEGLEPSVIQASFYDKEGLLTSANDYVSMLQKIAYNAFFRSRTGIEEDMGADALHHLDIFRKYAQEWVDPSLDRGPFVLVHGDLQPHNLIVDENMAILAVLDWEWSRVVPLQLFTPPLWLTNFDTTNLAWKFVYEQYLTVFDEFLSALSLRERETYGNELLAAEWAKMKRDGGFIVANALENWTDMDWVANRFINYRCYGGISDLEQRIRIFMEEDPIRSCVAEMKERQGVAYGAALSRLENDEKDTAGQEGLQISSRAKPQSILPWMRMSSIMFRHHVAGVTLLGGAAFLVTGISCLFERRMFRSPFHHMT